MANPASAAIAPVIGTPMLSAPANSAGAIAVEKNAKRASPPSRLPCR